uniref:histidine kinase n=1 Tax=Chromera velia CCMP2878 TaxID=1169474 RepID=A0A0G4GI36_9ALVE|eukprot:Cvel_21986.t1-p1 / transcript=Cvel_21986.t1 / gene=Cvel_21986 / organism=Chromera_velia_CCMP2878 / gene_product=hypothetical protein / transcript_product=hypothetical protein / location=Cvel_scaffold2117:9063-11103(-) / protein_length=330 / sequence_SO=supercontig / SO=protein_coding / is_pseudo=false
MAPTITPVAIMALVSFCFYRVMGVFDTAPFVVACTGFCALLLGVNPRVVFGRAPEKVRAREKLASKEPARSWGVGRERGRSVAWKIEFGEGGAEKLLDDRPLGVGDFLRLDQVVSNFLSNGLKFTKKGIVSLSFHIRLPSEAERSNCNALTEKVKQIRQRGRGITSDSVSGTMEGTTLQHWAAAISEDFSREEEAEQDSDVSMSLPLKSEGMEFVILRVCVSDTGPGLSAEDRARLFQPYGQIRAGELQKGGGTGLGLVICKSFVEAHAGGVIGVESLGRGEGSTFFFEFFLPLLEETHESPCTVFPTKCPHNTPRRRAASSCRMMTTRR